MIHPLFLRALITSLITSAVLLVTLGLFFYTFLLGGLALLDLTLRMSLNPLLSCTFWYFAVRH